MCKGKVEKQMGMWVIAKLAWKTLQRSAVTLNPRQQLGHRILDICLIAYTDRESCILKVQDQTCGEFGTIFRVWNTCSKHERSWRRIQVKCEFISASYIPWVHSLRRVVYTILRAYVFWPQTIQFRLGVQFPTWSVMSLLKKFQIWEHFFFHIFRLTTSYLLFSLAFTILI